MIRPVRSAAVALLLVASPAAWAQQETLEVTFDLAQYAHPGSWSFSLGCTHNPPTGRNNYVHITAVWLEDSNGNYVTTLHRWGRSYLFDLKAWSVAAGAGVDGVTSATPTSNGNLPADVFKTFTTGVRNVSNLPDGTYRVRLETSQCELADGYRTPPNPWPFDGGAPFGPTATFTFTKGRTSQSNAVLGSSAPFNNVRVNYVVPSGNAPPGVSAGPDQWRNPSTTPAEATTTLGGVVTDPDGSNPPTVQWTLVSTRPTGLTAAIATPSAASTSVTFSQAGVYVFRLTATDSGGLVSSDDVTVYVNAQLVPSAGDAEVNSNNVNTAMGIIENSGPWTWAWGPDTGGRSRAYFRFDLTGVTGQVTYASIWLRPAEQTPDPSLFHDFYILTDAQDDWNGAANTSTDYEATITWNNQPVAQGLASNLQSNQLAGTVAHLACLFRHSYADPNASPGQAATVCPARMEVDLNLVNVRAHDSNKVWSFFMAPRPAGTNGLGVASDENGVTTQLLVVKYWQSGTNQAPVAVPGTYAVQVDRTPPLGSESVTLDASGSTDDGAIVAYEWREGGVLLGASANPTFTTTLALGVHTLELTVIDGGGLSSKATTTVTVEDRFEPNHARAAAAAVTGTSSGQAYADLFAGAAAPAGDWYSVSLVAGSTLTVGVTMTGGNLDLHLYDGTGALLQSAATTSLTETASITAGAAGTYFVQVEAVGGASSRYAMTVTTSGSLQVQLNPASAVESAGTLVGAGTVRLDAPAASAVTVTLACDKPAQLTFPQNPITIAAGTSSATFDVRPVNDPAGVPNASRFVTISAAATGYNPGSALFEILDDEAALFVSWDKAAETVSETGSPSVQLRAVLSGPATGPVVVPFTVSGTATRGTDFSTPISAGQLTISSGTTATYLISVLDDTEVDPDETVVVTMGTPTGATASGATTYTLTISDDDGPVGGGAGGGGAAGGSSCGCTQGGGGLLLALGGLATLLRRRRRS